jgi:hypothetical protein
MNDWIQKIMELEKEVEKLKKVNFKLESRVLQLEQNSHGAESKPPGHTSLIRRLNCWEFKKCGREPGGTKVSELGICLAAGMEKSKGINRGEKGGRVCWALAGTLCGGRVQGIYAEKIASCVDCEFYSYVSRQEGQDFRHALPTKK